VHAPPAPSGDGQNLRRGCDSEGRRETPAMGFNPHRQYRRRPSDYVMVVAAVVVVLLLLAWALLG
jgi:hypothetical protein